MSREQADLDRAVFLLAGDAQPRGNSAADYVSEHAKLVGEFVATCEQSRLDWFEACDLRELQAIGADPEECAQLRLENFESDTQFLGKVVAAHVQLEGDFRKLQAREAAERFPQETRFHPGTPRHVRDRVRRDRS